MNINLNLMKELLHLNFLSMKRKIIKEVFDVLGEVKPDITNIRRLGKSTMANNGPITMLISSSNPWAVKKVLSKTPMLKNYKSDKANIVFLSKSLTKEEQQKEKVCLQKRWELISEKNVPRKETFIRNFEVYVNGKDIDE